MTCLRPRCDGGQCYPIQSVCPQVAGAGSAATFACAKKSPRPREHVQLFRMKQDRSKGFYSEKCEVEVSIMLCFEWDGCLVPRDVLPPFH